MAGHDERQYDDAELFDKPRWLVLNTPYLHADLAFSAENADRRDARLLGARHGEALLVLHRTTWNDLGPVTTVRVAFHPGHFVSTEGRSG